MASLRIVLLGWTLAAGCGGRTVARPASPAPPSEAAAPGEPAGMWWPQGRPAAPAVPGAREPTRAVTPAVEPTRPLEVPAPAVAPRRPGLHLFVSNQSFAIARIDLTVRIDGAVVIERILETGQQHTWHAFEIDLEPGRHRLDARTRTGGASLSTAFSVGRQAWGVLAFWYYPPTHYMPTARRLTFRLHDHPVLFE